MTLTVLPAARAAELRTAPYSYRPVGMTRGGGPPAGFRVDRFRRPLLRRDFDGAAEEVLGWQLHLRAGIRVSASALAAAPGVVVEQRIGPDRASIVAPCRVVYVLDEPDRRGFAYGTLRGHPEAGEESFVLERSATGAVELVITAMSRPAWWLARLGAPVARVIQRRVTERYLAALDT